LRAAGELGCPQAPKKTSTQLVPYSKTPPKAGSFERHYF
jgi:hypothetical protein